MRRVLWMAAALAVVGTTWPAPAHDRGLRLTRLVALTHAGAGSGGASAPPATTGRPRTARYTVDAPDVVRGNQTHIVYFVPRDRRDERLDVNGAIAGSIGSMRAWFRNQSGRSPRLDLRRGGALDITFVRGRMPAAEYPSLDDISDELVARGFRIGAKRFLVYAALPTGGVCGEAEYPVPPLDRTLGSFSAVYLDATRECGTRDFGNGTLSGAGRAEVVAAQEWLHNEGLVPLVAPHQCTSPSLSIPIPLAVGHVCTGPLTFFEGLDPEEPDVMYPFVTGLRLGQKVLDRGHDDYFRHSLPTADLADSAWMQ